MEDRWSDHDARALTQALQAQGIGEQLALRIYTSRLLGREPKLVLHGGGNVSVKLRAPDLLGNELDVLHIKGSGWDMGDIEAPGLPAVRLQPLKALRALDALSDEDMVDALRANLMNSRAPNPSVETLLHAYLPHAYVDHTHSVAVLSLIDQPDAQTLVEEVYGRRVALVPYVIPGFALAKRAAEVFEANPQVEGLILDKHGIFSFGATAHESYEQMIALVTLAEERLARGRKTAVATRRVPSTAGIAEIAPIVRGALSTSLGEGAHRRWILEFRAGPQIDAFLAHDALSRLIGPGVATPDHVIRVKPWPMVTEAPTGDDLAGFADAAKTAASDCEAAYDAYFAKHNARVGGIKTKLDPTPRIVLVPGLGFFAAGKSAKDAKIAADVYESAIATMLGAESIGRFQSIAEADIFDMEYWSLEQAKLGNAKEPPLARHVALVTGGAGAIGLATAKAFAAGGADVAILDLEKDSATAAAETIGPNALGLGCDVTKPEDLDRAFAAVCERFGGIDILVSNAGSAVQGGIDALADETLRKSFELNFFAQQACAQRAVRIMTAQGTGGCLLFNTSKQAINPGPNFGAYGLPKAAALFLSRQYALEMGRYGIRANAVNADRVRSGLLTDEMIASRSKARGLSEEEYLAGNLLGLEVRAADVAKAFVDLALSPKTTGAVLTVDGGNIAAALR